MSPPNARTAPGEGRSANHQADDGPPNNTRPDMLAAALELARNGIQVFPVRPGTKKPMIRTGPGHAVGATGNSSQIVDWWTKWPGASIGVSMAASNLFVVDVDGPAGHRYLQALEAQHGKLPATWTTISGREDRTGLHLWFRQPGWEPIGTIPQTVFGTEHQIEVRGIGSMVVAAPSQHKSGSRYEWGVGPGDLDAPAEAPRWLLDHLRALKPAPESPQDASDDLRVWLDALTARGSVLEPHTGYTLAQCPAHDDDTPSLSLRDMADGVAVKCFAGCTHHDIARALFGKIKVPEPDGPDVASSPAEKADPMVASIVDFQALFDDATGGSEWLVEPLIIRAASHLLWAGSGVGKSLLMLYISACLAAGIDPFTRQPRDPITVLYVDAEQSRDVIRERLQDMGFTPDQLGRLHYALMPDIGYLDTAEGGRHVVAYAKTIGADLVTLDTVSTLTDPFEAENSAEGARRLARFVAAPLVNADITVVRLDHESHKTHSKGAQGTAAKRRDVDVEWGMRKQDGTGYRIERHKDRRAFVPATVDVHLVEDPRLRFTFDETWPEGTRDVADWLDAHAVPYDWTYAQVKDRMDALDYDGPRRKTIVLKGMKFRDRRRLSPPTEPREPAREPSSESSREPRNGETVENGENTGREPSREPSGTVGTVPGNRSGSPLGTTGPDQIEEELF